MLFHIFSSAIALENEVSFPIQVHHAILQEKVDSPYKYDIELLSSLLTDPCFHCLNRTDSRQSASGTFTMR